MEVNKHKSNKHSWTEHEHKPKQDLLRCLILMPTKYKGISLISNCYREMRQLRWAMKESEDDNS